MLLEPFLWLPSSLECVRHGLLSLTPVPRCPAWPLLVCDAIEALSGSQHAGLLCGPERPVCRPVLCIFRHCTWPCALRYSHHHPPGSGLTLLPCLKPVPAPTIFSLNCFVFCFIFLIKAEHTSYIPDILYFCLFRLFADKAGGTYCSELLFSFRAASATGEKLVSHPLESSWT